LKPERQKKLDRTIEIEKQIEKRERRNKDQGSSQYSNGQKAPNFNPPPSELEVVIQQNEAAINRVVTRIKSNRAKKGKLSARSEL
jgi:hypothetical protein